MPPKRKAPSKQPPPTTTTTPRRSKLAKEHNISAAQETAIQEAFQLFLPSSEVADKHSTATLPSNLLRRALAALNAPPSSAAELKELLSVCDPDDEGEIEYEPFVAVAALKLHSVSHSKGRKGRNDDEGDEERDEEVRAAYMLFTQGVEGREITVRDLRRIAKELREEVPEEVLRDMVREAKGGGDGKGGVGFEEFAGVMERAGVF